MKVKVKTDSIEESFEKLVRAFYERIPASDRAQYITGTLIALENSKLPSMKAWCEIEEIDELLELLLLECEAKYDLDIEDTLTRVLFDQQEADKEALEEYYEKQATYREMTHLKLLKERR